MSSAKLRVKNFKTIEVLDPLLPSMAQGGKGKKLLSLLEKKDVANTARTAIRKEAEESNSMVIGSITAVVGVLYCITEAVFLFLLSRHVVYEEHIIHTKPRQDLNYSSALLPYQFGKSYLGWYHSYTDLI